MTPSIKNVNSCSGKRPKAERNVNLNVRICGRVYGVSAFLSSFLFAGLG